MARLNSIDVNSTKKLLNIMSKLKASGRRAFYEQMYNFNGAFYTIYYRPKEVNE